MINIKAVLKGTGIFALFVFCSGCASVFNPYSDEFQCEETYKGRCADIHTAYGESVNNMDSKEIARMKEKCEEEGKDCNKQINPFALKHKDKISEAKTSFQTRQFVRLAGLIDEPEAPLVAPPEIVRVLILSYTTDENAMMGYRHAYFIASPPRWILSTFDERGN